MSESLKNIERLLDECTTDEQAALLDYLKARLPQHPLEKEWGVGAEECYLPFYGSDETRRARHYCGSNF